MDILAVSYVLPPYLYPQAIQIGRLLYHLEANIGVVSGTVRTHAVGLDCYPDFNQKLAFRLTVPHKTRLSGLAERLATYLLPFYARCPDEFRGWIPKAEKKILDLLPDTGLNPKVLISFGEPMSDHLLGLRLKKQLRLPWIAHFSDPWADSPFRRYYVLSNLINKRMEADVIHQADRVVFTSQETLELVMRKYPNEYERKARVIPHGYESALYIGNARKSSSETVIRYLGNFYGHRTPLPLFKGLTRIHEECPEILQHVVFELVGNIPARMLNNTWYRSLPPSLVRIVPTVTYSEALSLMSCSDTLLVIDSPADLSVFLPSKLVDYLGSGVPILGIVPPGASAQLIQRLGGMVANPSSETEVAVALRITIEMAKRRRSNQSDGDWGNADVLQEYRAETVARQFLSIIHEAIGSN